MDKRLVIVSFLNMKEIKAKKSLGQNFLKDENILKKISSLVEPKSDDLLMEIGPGMGALTKYLALKKVPYIAYEIDERMNSYLENIPVKVYYEDFLKADFSKLPLFHDLYVVANIPYYITTPIIEHILKNIIPKEMVLLVQKEVALRFSAKPSTSAYGYFTVFLSHYFETSYLFDVPSSAFSPAPKVTSSIIHFKRKEHINQIDEKLFFAFVKKCFSMKRKTLKNNLSKEEWEKIKPILFSLNYDENVRAETLSYEDFVEIFKSI